MDSKIKIKTETAAYSQCNVELVCPCEHHAALELEGEDYKCPKCHSRFPREMHTWDFSRGQRFNDDPCECMWCNEESTGRHLVENYVHPLLQEILARKKNEGVKILSIGCGVGSDIEALNQLGYCAFGIDAGNRAEYWSRRSTPERYYLANAKALPFADESFDVIIMGCVLPHIGVGDDTYQTEDNYQQERQIAADEMLRVTRPGGSLILSSPNRKCPVDFFHRANVANHMPRFHSVNETFLMSIEDYADALKVGDRCDKINVLPLKGYWGFYSSSTYLLGRILQIPVRFYFNHLLSWNWTKFLRSSMFNPWLILHIKKKS